VLFFTWLLVLVIRVGCLSEWQNNKLQGDWQKIFSKDKTISLVCGLGYFYFCLIFFGMFNTLEITNLA